jgi:hypothetical protein
MARGSAKLRRIPVNRPVDSHRGLVDVGPVEGLAALVVVGEEELDWKRSAPLGDFD